ncbi:MAG: PfkB family carbohydrate kinase [Acholeplasmataceae bacterium]
MNAVDMTGAGDAFIGAFSRCLFKNICSEAKLRFCNATSALVCTKSRVQQSMPTLDEVLKFLRK